MYVKVGTNSTNDTGTDNEDSLRRITGKESAELRSPPGSYLPERRAGAGNSQMPRE